MVLGLFVYGANIGCSAATEERPWLARLLSDFAHERLPEGGMIWLETLLKLKFFNSSFSSLSSH